MDANVAPRATVKASGNDDFETPTATAAEHLVQRRRPFIDERLQDLLLSKGLIPPTT